MPPHLLRAMVFTCDSISPPSRSPVIPLTLSRTGRRCLAATSAAVTGDLLLLLPALAFLEGSFQQAPEPEDLQMAMLEDGLSAPIRRVLDAMSLETGPAQSAASAAPVRCTISIS